MSKPKITKTMLIEENATLKAEVERWKKQDETLRREFSQALDAPMGPVGEYDVNVYRQVQHVYSWYEVFREVGRLLEYKHQSHVENELRRVRQQLEDATRLIEQQRAEQCDGPRPERPFRN